MLPVRNPGPGHLTPGGSVSNFADFVTTPAGRARRGQKPLRMSGLNPSSSKGSADQPDDVDEVLFDEDEMAGGVHTTDESLSASGSGGRGSTDDDRASASSTGRRGGRANRS